MILIQTRGQYGSDNAHFWIDTFCAPTHNKQAKTLAFQKMGQIYSRAEKVLVFDNSLRLASGFTYSDDLYQRSGGPVIWATCLWTLRERRPIPQPRAANRMTGIVPFQVVGLPILEFPFRKIESAPKILPWKIIYMQPNGGNNGPASVVGEVSSAPIN